MPGPKRVRSVTLQLVPWMARQVRARGLEPAALLARFGLPPRTEELAELSLPLSTLRRFGDACAEAVGDPEFGVSCAQALPRGAYGLLEFTARSAPDLAGALERLVRYQRLLNDVISMRFDAQARAPSLHHLVPGEPEAMGAQANAFTVAAFVKLCRELTGVPDWAPRSAWVAHPAPDGLPRLTAFVGTEVRCAAAENGLSFDRALLTRALPSADPELMRVLEIQTRAAAEAKARATTVVEHAELALERVLQRGERGVPAVAAELHLSARTLQRRLAEEGSSFQQVVDRVGQRLARAWVDEGRLPLGEIAYRLGYSELRAFVRAYKRWTGTTPGAERTRRAQA